MQIVLEVFYVYRHVYARSHYGKGNGWTVVLVLKEYRELLVQICKFIGEESQFYFGSAIPLNFSTSFELHLSQELFKGVSFVLRGTLDWVLVILIILLLLLVCLEIWVLLLLQLKLFLLFL